MSAPKGNGPDAINDRPAKTHTKYATNFIAPANRQTSATARFPAKPCHGIGKAGKDAARGCATVLPGASKHHKVSGQPLRQRGFFTSRICRHGKSHGAWLRARMASAVTPGARLTSCFEHPRPPVWLQNWTSGSSVSVRSRTMTTVNTPTTPKTGTTSPLARQQAIENALCAALYFIRLPYTDSGLQAATGRAIRAASMLKQACSEIQNGSAA